MEFRSAIVDELEHIMFWCDELQDETQIKCILNSHPEWKIAIFQKENRD